MAQANDMADGAPGLELLHLPKAVFCFVVSLRSLQSGQIVRLTVHMHHGTKSK